MMEYTTLDDARTALQNSGVFEWFDLEQEAEVIEWMYRHDATPEQAAEHFGVAD